MKGCKRGDMMPVGFEETRNLKRYDITKQQKVKKRPKDIGAISRRPRRTRGRTISRAWPQDWTQGAIDQRENGSTV